MATHMSKCPDRVLKETKQKFLLSAKSVPYKEVAVEQGDKIYEPVEDGLIIFLNFTVFRWEDITIHLADRRLLITASHQEYADMHGFVKRSCKREYDLSEDLDLKSLTALLNSHGLLRVQAKKTIPLIEMPIYIDIKHFRPLNIYATREGRTIIIRGKHREYADMHGAVAREFSRYYTLPSIKLAKEVVVFQSGVGILKIDYPAKETKHPTEGSEQQAVGN